MRIFCRRSEGGIALSKCLQYYTRDLRSKSRASILSINSWDSKRPHWQFRRGSTSSSTPGPRTHFWKKKFGEKNAVRTPTFPPTNVPPPARMFDDSDYGQSPADGSRRAGRGTGQSYSTFAKFKFRSPQDIFCEVLVWVVLDFSPRWRCRKSSPKTNFLFSPRLHQPNQVRNSLTV